MNDEDDVSQELLKRLREAQKQLQSARQREETLESQLLQSQEKRKEQVRRLVTCDLFLYLILLRFFIMRLLLIPHIKRYLFWQLSLFTQALEIKKLNKLVGVTESPKFGNESRKDLKVRLARAQEDLKDLQLSSAERVKQVRGRICKFDYC